MHPAPGRDLMAGPPPTLLPADTDAADRLAAGAAATAVAAELPAVPLVWAVLAEQSSAAGDAPVTAYAYARTGYHRGLDLLRRHGWKGFGPVPWSHPGNQGWLRCVAALARAATAIGEADEAARCRQLLVDCDPAAPAALGVAD